MKNALVICTFMRPHAVQQILNSIKNQTVLPDQVVIVDGSFDCKTKNLISMLQLNFKVDYFLVNKDSRGLTKQRNYGVSKVNCNIDIISFLDDDIILEPNYFEEIINTFANFSDAIGVGGIDLKENCYFKKELNVKYSKFKYFEVDGWLCTESSRNLARKFFGLMPQSQPYIIPSYSHGRSGLPPNGKTYRVEHFMGGIAAYKKNVFDNISFSTYFEGYGLYEDFDFCVRSLKYGGLYVNTNAQVWHYHEPSGRPNAYKYGKMVIRNGWYVWKQRYPKSTTTALFKWYSTALLLAFIRLLNTIKGPFRRDAINEFLGRCVGLFSLWYNRPKLQ